MLPATLHRGPIDGKERTYTCQGAGNPWPQATLLFSRRARRHTSKLRARVPPRSPTGTNPESAPPTRQRHGERHDSGGVEIEPCGTIFPAIRSCHAGRLRAKVQAATSADKRQNEPRFPAPHGGRQQRAHRKQPHGQRSDVGPVQLPRKLYPNRWRSSRCRGWRRATFTGQHWELARCPLPACGSGSRGPEKNRPSLPFSFWRT